VYVYDARGRLSAEYGDSTTNAQCVTCYLTTDALGSTRMMMDQAGTAVARYDYLPFGQEILPPQSGGRASVFCGTVSCYSQSGAITEKFTAKERDAETGLDYFGARYFSSAGARFTTPDPLMASAKASNPQTWNRYAYALNNPLRFVDPDGLEVPEECVKDPNCMIKVKVNVIYDKTVQGLTDQQKRQFEKNQLEKAKKDFGHSNIQLEFSYTEGSYTDQGLTGVRSDSLNLVVSNKTPTGDPGVSHLTNLGDPFSIVNFQAVDNTNDYFGSVTTEHEFGHQFLGHPFEQPRDPFSHVILNTLRDINIDYRNTRQERGINQPAYREGLAPRRYAVPANPELNKPQK